MNDARTSRHGQVRIGEVLGPYRVTRLLGGGGMGSVYLAEAIPDGRLVALKLLHDDVVRDPMARERFIREAQAAAAIQHPCVAEVHGIHEEGGAVFIAMEYVEGGTLRELLDAQRGAPLEVREALRIAHQIAGALSHAHAVGVIHRDLKPENLMFDASGRIKVLDFGLAKRVGTDESDLASAATLQFATVQGTILGTPGYMAPEQIQGGTTDARTDIFSLGVLLYEMATGVRPFAGQSSMEMLIATARDPHRPASQVNPRIPPGLNDLLSRMLHKLPMFRVDSAEAVREAIEELMLVEVESDLLGTPAGGVRGRTGELLPSRRLRGREAEARALHTAIARAKDAPPRLLLVRGPAGAGKSALLASVRASMARAGGRFVSGAFDRQRHGDPLAPLGRALGVLVDQFAAEAGEHLLAWQEDLAHATGHNRQIIELVPELRRVIGEPATAASLGYAAEARNRFHAALQRLVRLLAARAAPLVLALDDLDCADPAALQLVELVLTDPAGSSLLVIGTCRDGGDAAADPLAQTCDNLGRRGGEIEVVALGPLPRAELVGLVADWLGCDEDEAGRLAARLDEIAHGNPARLRQALLDLRRADCLRFASSVGRWQWDEAAVALPSPKDTAAALVRRVAACEEGVQRVLALAAVFGRAIDFATLSAVDGRSPLATSEDLRVALRDGLLVASETADEAEAGGQRFAYEFTDDALRLAVESALSADERAAIHVAIGRYLLRARSHGSPLFAALSHLERGAAALTDPGEREQLAELHLEAARRARGSTAHALAARHAIAGLAALPDDPWREHARLAVRLHQEWMYAAAMSGDLATGDRLFAELVDHVEAPLVRAELHRDRAQLDVHLGRTNSALEVGLAGLALLGVPLVRGPAPEVLAAEHEAVLTALAGVEQGGGSILAGASDPAVLAALIDRPACSDPGVVAILDLLVATGPAAMFTDIRLAFCVFMRITRLWLTEGPTRVSAYGLAGYGLYLASVHRAWGPAYVCGQIAQRLHRRFDDPAIGGRALQVVGALLTGWTAPFADAAVTLEEGYSLAARAGDYASATYNVTSLIFVLVARRHSLTEVCASAEKYLVAARPMLEVYGSGCIRGALRMCQCLAGAHPGPRPGSARQWISAVFLRDLEREGEGTPLTQLYLHMYASVVLYHFGCHRDLPELPAPAAARLANLVTPMAVDYYFYAALHAAAAIEAGAGEDRQRELAGHLEHLREFATRCQVNFEARALLASAEYDRVCGRHEQAEAGFKQAIRSARRHGELGTEALARELAGRLTLARGDDVVGHMYVESAIAAYQQWGAEAVARRLAGALPELG